MDPASAGALINVAGSIATGQADRERARVENADNRRYEYEMYKKQKADAIEFWNMQNSYNSPEAQRQRLEAAGLNPALMYGAGSGGAGEASNIQAPSMNSTPLDTRNLHTDLGGIGSMWYDTQLKSQSLDNLKKDADLKDRQAALLAAQELKTIAETGRYNFDLFRDNTSLNWDMQAREAKAKGFIIENQYKANEDARQDARLRIEEARNTREGIRLGDDLRTAVTRRLNTMADTKNKLTQYDLMKLDEKLRNFEIRMNESNISKNDPYYVRMADGLFRSLFNAIGNGKGLRKAALYR